MKPFRPPRSESLVIRGPAGDLEALIQDPAQTAAGAVAVVCHPHPQFEGTMHNKVVHTLARGMNQLGAPAVRFNYRGVGSSAGVYDEGIGETADALAVAAWATSHWSGHKLVFAGFSFGAAVAMRASEKSDPSLLITVAPAVGKTETEKLVPPKCPWLIVIGDRDELVDCEEVIEWVNRLSPGPELSVVQGAEHFFHGRLNDLKRIVVNWVEDTGVLR